MSLISQNTQATLLLCGQLNSHKSNKLYQPLNTSEYNRVVSYLLKHDLAPVDLLKPELNLQLDSIDNNRLHFLLNRGVLQSLLTERWASLGLWVLGRGDAQYPSLLKNNLKWQCPPLLFGIGNPELLKCSQAVSVLSSSVTPALKTIALGFQKPFLTVPDYSDLSQTIISVTSHDLLQLALRKQYRTAISQQRLLLVSPFDPIFS